MEIVKNRDGDDRVFIRVNFEKLRVISEESIYRIYRDKKSGELKMFDFQGGPMINVGGKINFEGMFWKVDKIDILPSNQSLNEILLKVSPVYNVR
jgi:hypothetical protein